MAVQAHLGHKASWPHSAAWDGGVSEVGQQGGQVTDAILNEVDGMVYQHENLKIRIKDGYLKWIEYLTKHFKMFHKTRNF